MIIKSHNNSVPLAVFSQQSSSQLNSRSTQSSAIVCGIDAVRACGSEHGIVDSHLSILSDLAKKNNVVFGFRPVNPLATQLLEQGYPTKDLNIKGKSADWGPMAGFIPVLQRFSKTAGNTEEIKKSDAEINDCIHKGHAVSIALVINKERLDMLCEMKVISSKVRKGADKISIHAEKNNQQYVFTAELSYRNQIAEYAIAHQGEPLHVLAKPGEGKNPARALSADYDLLLFAVPLAQFGHQDNFKSSTNTGKAIADNLLRNLKKIGVEADDQKENFSVQDNAAKATSRLLKNRMTVDKEELDRGIISPRLNKFIPEINKALGRTNDNGVVQHGADTQNPYTVIADNYPSVIFLPKRVGHYGGVVMARNKTEATQIYKEIKDSGFQFFGNDKWAVEMPVETYRRSSFNEALNALENGALLSKGIS